MNTRHTFIVAVIGIVLIIGGYFFLETRKDAAPSVKDDTSLIVAREVIQMNEDGFFPHDVHIKVGEAVRFENTGLEWHWPASNLHPTHELYPEFDPREPIAPQESWAFVFTKKGGWMYHDHLEPNHRGTVYVE